MAGFDDTVRKAQALAKQHDAAFTAATTPVPGFARSSAMAFAIGTRVIDLVTGQTGTVTNGKREHITFPAAGVGSGGDGVREA
jgi:hypothetical protein